MKNIKQLTVLGSGAMGFGMAYVVSTNRTAKVRLWDHDLNLVSEIKEKRINTKHSIPEIRLPDEVALIADLEEAVEGSDLTLLAVPSFAVREMSKKLSRFSPFSLLMISKGMEKETSLLPFQVAEEILGKINILHLTGAGYGKEVHKKIPTTEALASKNEDLLEEVKEIFENDWLTIKTSTDLLGTQLAGALKNVMVIGIGMVLGQRKNSELRTKLIDEGVQEMITLGQTVRAEEKTFRGPAGKGDLEFSSVPTSRNFKLGQDLVEKGLEEVQQELIEKGKTVEGLHTAFAVHQLIQKYKVRLPIVEEVYKVFYEKKDPQSSIKTLLKLVEHA